MAVNYHDDNLDYDPIKYAADGKQAQAVIWSTKALNMALEGLNKGLPLKANPFIGKNTKLLKPDLVIKKTKEEIDDYMKCMNDPVYFASKCYLMTPEGLKPVILRDYQVDYLRHLQHNRFSLFLSCRQSGKTLNMSSKIYIKISLKNVKNIDYLLKKYYFYINNNNYIIELPIFELIHLFDKSIIAKLRYNLYKIIYNINKWQEKKNQKVKDVQNIIKNIFQN